MPLNPGCSFLFYGKERSSRMFLPGIRRLDTQGDMGRMYTELMVMPRKVRLRLVPNWRVERTAAASGIFRLSRAFPENGQPNLTPRLSDVNFDI